MSLELKLAELKKLEDGLIFKSRELMKSGETAYIADLFVIGAIKRIITLSSGFRILISDKNFPCSAAILRMQIDTAARLNALTIVKDVGQFCMQLFDGQRFDRIKDQSGHRLKDFYLIDKLSSKYPWVKGVYEETSDFIHLSTRHAFSAILGMDTERGIFRFQIDTKDPDREESEYFEILDAFIEASKIASLIAVGYIAARNGELDKNQNN